MTSTPADPSDAAADHRASWWARRPASRWARRRRRAVARRLAGIGDPAALAELARALVASGDAPVRELAASRLARLSAPGDQEANDAVCGVWAACGSPALDALVDGGGWVAAQPPPVRVRTALRAGRPEALMWDATPTRDDAAIARALVALAGSPDPLAGAAEDAARALRGANDRMAVFRLAMDGDETARRIVASAELPSDASARHAFTLFLAGDFERCSEVDPDGSLLAVALAVAPIVLHSELALRARESGRREWVEAVAGPHLRRWGELPPYEWDTVTAVLASGGDAEELWRLAQCAPPARGVPMLRALAVLPWRPAAEAERRLHGRLTAIAARCEDLPVHPELHRGETEVGPPARAAYQVDSVVLDGGRTVRRGRYLPLEDGNRLVDLVFAPDARSLIVGTDRELRVLTVRRNRLATRLRLSGHRAEVRDVAVSPDGATLVSIDQLGDVVVWRLSDGARLGGYRPAPRARCLPSVSLTPDGRFVLVPLNPEELGILTLETGEVVGRVSGGVGAGDFAVTPDGSFLVTVYRREGLRWWCLPTGRPVGAPDKELRTVRDVVALSGETVVATTHSHRRVLVSLWSTGLRHVVDGPVERIDPDELADVRHLAWGELAWELAAWHRRFDVVVDETRPGRGSPGPGDIAIDPDPDGPLPSPP